MKYLVLAILDVNQPSGAAPVVPGVLGGGKYKGTIFLG